MKLTLIWFGLFASGLLWVSIRALARGRTLWRWLQLVSAVCLGMVVFAHVAEEFHLFPGMGWGQPHSSGHYLDLAGAVMGLTLLPVGFCGGTILRSRSTKAKTN